MDHPILLVSLDFELFWGMQDAHTLASYQDHVLGGRKAIPKMLDLFSRHGIHATWAAVGFMFARDEQQLRGFFPEPAQRPSYCNPALSPYRCFETIGKNEEEAPCFYAPSLIRMIAASPGQEIGSHTFSHYYCREAGQTPAQFEADLKAAVAIAREEGYELKSIVLPRNQCRQDYIPVMREQGFAAYRDEENDWIHRKIRNTSLKRILRLMDVYMPITGYGGYRPVNEDGIWNLVGSRMYKPYFRALSFLEGLKVHRIKRQMLHAAKNGLVFHLWWHPHNVGVRTDFHLGQLEEIFSCFDLMKAKYGMESLNMKEAAQRLEEERL